MSQKLLLLITVLIFNSCAKPSESAPLAKDSSDSWLVYEDDMFRAEYPPNSEIVAAPGAKQDPKSPSFAIIPPPAAGKSVIGAFVLQPDKTSKEMLLRDGIQAEIKRTMENRGVLISPAREFQVKNGRCLGSIVLSPTTNCVKGTGSCFAPIYSVLCDGPNGARYTAGTVLSSGPTRDRLSPQAQQEAATYERILRSLEFKKS